MKAVVNPSGLPSSDPGCLLDTTLPRPEPAGRDVLIHIEAISVNPVDTKIRNRPANAPRVLGWDAAGTVVAIGPDVEFFKPGDTVWHAGDVTRPGCNSEYQLVDERIVGRKPRTLTFTEAAALPLTTLTAWVSLFERLGVARDGSDAGKALLMIGAPGGVGSIAIQLAKLAGLTVIATASRPASAEWVRELGADHVVDPKQPLAPQLEALGCKEVPFIANWVNTDAYWETMAAAVAPLGKVVCIVSNVANLNLDLLKSKSAVFAWEFMFTRPMYRTPDMVRHHEILNEVAGLVDSGKLRTTLRQTLAPINAANLRQAHLQLESGTTLGKVVLAGW